MKIFGKVLLFSLAFTLVKSEISHVNLVQYEDISAPDLSDICLYFRNVSKVTEICVEQLEIVCESLTDFMAILDASAKFPYDGMAYSSKWQFGNYDECMTVDYPYGDGGRILGEHCTSGLILPDLGDKTKYYQLAVCRPNGCSATDYNAIINDLFNLSAILNTTEEVPLFQDLMCQTVESYTTYTTGDIVVLSLFAFVIFLMILSTIYDLHLYKNDLKPAHPLLLAFSVLSNGRKLLHISKHYSSKQQIEIFHGIRVISMMWIVAGHGIILYEYIPVVNASDITKWMKQMYGVYITAGPLAVDTFFFMSGFLMAFQYFKGKIKSLTEQLISVPHVIIHRYLRLTPAMLMIYLVVITFFIHMGSGPIWGASGLNNQEVCKKHWWQFFLYIQNWKDTKDVMDICLIQTWYLSADMQLFLISPLILIPLSLLLKKTGSKSVMVALLGLNIFFTFLPMTTKLVFKHFDKTFDTYSRLIDYFIGITLGLFMRVKFDKPFLYMCSEQRRSLINMLIWPVIILGMLATVICYRDVELHHGYNTNAVFTALMRPAWCIGLSWITYSCYHGHGGIVNWILCRPIFQILGRLTYCIYLTHITVQAYFIGSIRDKLYFDDYQAFYLFCGHYIVSVIVAVFWTLAFESPLIIIEKYLLGGGNKPANESKKQENGHSVENGKNPA